MKNRSLITTGTALTAVGVAFAFFLHQEEPAEAPEAIPEPPTPEFHPLRAEVSDVSPEATPEEEPVAAHYFEQLEEANRAEDARMKANHPRATWVENLRPGELPEGYQFHGVRVTDRGFELEPPHPGEEGSPRMGIVESSAMEFDFASNGVKLAWDSDLPEGTSALIELSVSRDGENWEAWNEGDIHHDSYGLYPEGSPHLPAAHSPGHLFLVWGDDQLWTHWRYRISLYSEGPESPAVGSMTNSYEQTAGGRGEAGGSDPSSPGEP